MNNIRNMSDFIGVRGDGSDVLGKVLYYSLTSILIRKDELLDICRATGFPYPERRRESLTDAFRSATGDIYKSKVENDVFYKVYCRDNESTHEYISRELIKETVRAETNEYKKLANISFYRESKTFSQDNVVWDEHVAVWDFINQAEELFELYQQCVSRKQLEKLVEAYIESMDAVKIVGHGKIYFIPRDYTDRLDLLEAFIELLAEHNIHKNRSSLPLDVNSMYVVDDAKQREKMAGAFYREMRKEIEAHQEKMSYLIQSGSQSPSVMERRILKADALTQKKAYYEDILKRELSDLDDEYSSLGYLADELKIRIRGIRFQKSAA